MNAAELDALVARFDPLGLTKAPRTGPRDPDAFDLRLYWTLGKGAAKVAWGFKGDHERCTIALGKHVGEDRAKRICAAYHIDLFGEAPRESVVAAKPDLPAEWDFDADSPEDAMPQESDEAPANEEPTPPEPADEDDTEDEPDEPKPDTRTRRERERDARRGRGRNGRGKADEVPDPAGVRLGGLRGGTRADDVHERPDSGGALGRKVVGELPMKHKGITVGKIKAGGDDGLGEGEFTAYASVFDVLDSYGDVVQRGAFTKSIAAWAKSGNTLPILYGHDAKNPHMNVGGVVSMVEDERGLKIHGRLDLDTPTGDQVYRLVKGRRLSQLSFAYDEVRTRPVKGDPRLGNYKSLEELHLHEVSLVPVGANRETSVLAVKAAPTGPSVKAWDAYFTAARFGSVPAPL
ncbi:MULTISPECIES: HK97 family phage prohead protease [unclassified Rhodococcus (in: high G+C Gram-positive bacteria)]|uniref:HK97 family phage prohead protease n=1 Tax=unclassified Rhodococcus (in: high G+C Gram-positive bacteria) TaxID=192944 RepID=UPI0024B6B613|nr:MULTISPECIES: HK97 family phage prohead protease [unclassified Rhodococcus (in: high G+C Gram-positive bacteria)]MDI9959228.1 HK97 family phage prohead protease [Rhodococcus sp. IEGM 1237]MDI9964784.1 HK97 family phage prohead protease [Rhodococcus sp. IEGM 1251]MDV8127111.1 HK97 family phage prohead protease [Rhodococcus sp. IEGM 1304]